MLGSRKPVHHDTCDEIEQCCHKEERYQLRFRYSSHQYENDDCIEVGTPGYDAAQVKLPSHEEEAENEYEYGPVDKCPGQCVRLPPRKGTGDREYLKHYENHETNFTSDEYPCHELCGAVFCVRGEQGNEKKIQLRESGD